MNEGSRTLPLLTTGDDELDRILGGGLPIASVTVVAGAPGTGKTVVALQLLFEAARKGKRGLYFTTLAEPSLKLLRYAQLFGFFEPDLVGSVLQFTDLSAAIRAGRMETLEAIESHLERHNPDVVVIDSFSAIEESLPPGGVARPFAHELAVVVSGWGATTLLLGSYAERAAAGAPEFSIADGIVELSLVAEGLTAVREIEVKKMRGLAPITGRHFFDICPDRTRFFPRVRSPDGAGPPVPLAERISTGSAELDLLFDGGLPRASSTIVQGGTGTGKTILALQFAMCGARAGEKVVYFSLEETPDQLREYGAALGFDLGAAEQQGNLVIKYDSPVELSTDRFLHEARATVERHGARRAVFDSLTSLALGVASERRFKELTYAVTKHFRALGVTLVMTLETPELLGAHRLSAQGVSFSADNVIQLRYFENEGRLERALSVIKARGIKQVTELRSISVGCGGLAVGGGRFRDLRGVLTGLPSSVRPVE